MVEQWENFSAVKKTPQNFLRTVLKAHVSPYYCALKFRLLDRKIKLAEGQPQMEIPKGGFVLFCAFKNAEMFLEAFITHYSQLGCSQFYFFDDGSTDRSREIVRQYSPVAVFESDLKYIENQGLFRGWFINRFARGRWSVTVDVDELLDFSGSSQVSFGDFLGYLDQHGYEGATACMVDRFSSRPMGHSRYVPGQSLSETFDYYDCSDVRRFPLLPREIGFRAEKGSFHWNDFYGGVRGAQFNFWPRLLKVPLLKYRRGHGVRIHMVTNVKLADVELVLNHYRYMDQFLEISKQSESAYTRGGMNLEAIDSENMPSLYNEATAVKWTNADALYSDLLQASSRYRQWASLSAGEEA